MSERCALAVNQSAVTRPTVFVFSRIGILAALGVSISLLYWLRLNRAIGLGGDDAWYVLLAQSLATGQGYQLLNSPVSGILPLYPPFFPFLLSLWLRCLPSGAEHLWLLKLVSVGAMIGLGAVTFVYATRLCRLPSLISVAMTMTVILLPAFVFLATSTVMSECVFALAQLLTVVCIEKALRQDGLHRAAWYWWSGGAMLAGITFLTRSIAVSLLLAVVLYLLKERRVKAAMLFIGSLLLVIAPWMFYTRAHATSDELKQLHGGNIVCTYSDAFWMKSAGDKKSGTETARDLPTRIWRNLHNIGTRDFCGMFFPSLLRSARESGEESFSLGETNTLGGGNMKGLPVTAALSLSLFLLAFLGFVVTARQQITLTEILLPCSLVVIVLWPWWTFRFVLPLAPFLLQYIVVGLTTIARSVQRFWPQSGDVWALPRIFLLCVLALFVHDHFGYLYSQMQNPEDNGWLSEHYEASDVLAWVRTHVPPDTVIASTSPARMFLYTGHKGVSCDDPLGNQEAWQRLDVRYLVVLSSHGITALDGQERDYPVVYRTANDMRVIDLKPFAEQTTSKR